MDEFFNIINIKKTHEADRKLKPFLKPFSSHDDASGKMFLSWQTYEGIIITVRSVIELVQFDYRKMYHMFSLKDFVKIHWKIILDIKDQWVIEKKILRYMMWGIMTIPSATEK